MQKRLLVVGALAGLMALVPVLPAGALTKAQLSAKALAVSDLPAGWSVDHTSSGGVTATGCLSALQGEPKGVTRVAVDFTDGDSPTMQETLESGTGSSARYRAYRHTLSSCKKLSIKSDGVHFTGTIKPIPFTSPVSGSSTYAVALKGEGTVFGFDITVFQIGKIVASFGYAAIGTPDPNQVRAFLTEAVDKVEGKTVVPPTSTPTT
jgi:hypothetical protein